MDFELNEECKLFRDAVRKWVVKECPKDWCRELERKEHEYPQALWDKLTEGGFNGIGIEEHYGGMGDSAETDMQRYWRDARLMSIGPISNEMARNMIAEELGLPRSY